MEKVMNILKPKPNPQQLLRDWQRKLRQECRNIERQIRGNYLFFISLKTLIYWLVLIFVFDLDIQREEKNVQKAIKEAAKRNDIGSAKVIFFYLILRSVRDIGYDTDTQVVI